MNLPGRVATKVMQTSLAVREAVMKVMDILVYVVVYFASMIAMVATSDYRLALPLVWWIICYVSIISYFVPKLKRVSQEQADARSIMTGRIVDSYTNINTVKLFSHAGREVGLCEGKHGRVSARRYTAQMRLVTLFQVLIYYNNALVVFLIARIVDLAMAGRRCLCGRDCGGGRPGAAPQRHVAMDHVGSFRAVREYRRDA